MSRVTKKQLEEELALYKLAFEHVSRMGITTVTEGWGGRQRHRYMNPEQARSNSLGYARNQLNKGITQVS